MLKNHFGCNTNRNINVIEDIRFRFPRFTSPFGLKSSSDKLISTEEHEQLKNLPQKWNIVDFNHSGADINEQMDTYKM